MTIIGTSPDMIDAAEDRERFQAILHKLGLHQPPNGIATNTEGARHVAQSLFKGARILINGHVHTRIFAQADGVSLQPAPTRCKATLATGAVAAVLR